MSPYEHLFSCNSVLSVWKNVRAKRDQNDLLLTFQYQPEKKKGGKGDVVSKGKWKEEGGEVEEKTVKAKGSHIGFVVPWRSLQAREKQLKDKERELAEALVVLAGEMMFEDLPTALQSSATTNPFIQVRHIAAGISRQMSKIEIQMYDNAPYCRGKNLYTGGEIVRKFLPAIQLLFVQQPVPQRMIFELLMELKDLVLYATQDLDKQLLEDDLNSHNSFEELDDSISAAFTPIVNDNNRTPNSQSKAPPPLNWLNSEDEILYHLESLETTSDSMHRLGVDDFCAKSTITLRRMVDRRSLYEFAVQKKKRTGQCDDYARCMKWAGTSWRQGGGCRRGCKSEDEDPGGLPSWHSSSRNFDRVGTQMIGNGEVGEVVRVGT